MRCLYALAAPFLLESAVLAAKHEQGLAHKAFHDLFREPATLKEENVTCAEATSDKTRYNYDDAALIQPVFQAPIPTTSATPLPLLSSAAPLPTTPSSLPLAIDGAQPASTPAKPSSEKEDTSIITNSQWCMTYTPYTSTGACKDAHTVASDVVSIASKGFTSIRLYSTDCDGLEKIVPVAASHSMKIVLGIFIDQRGISPASEQIGDIMDYFKGNYESVEMVVVGNEAIFSEYCSASELAAFIGSVKSTLQSAGYTGPVTTTEPMHIIAANAAILCPVIDVIGANIHGFFHSDISAADAGSFVATSLAELEGYCPGNKQAWNLETGWPSSGTANGKAIPGALEQEIAIMGIVKSAGSRSAIFSFEDDLWKNEGDFEVETSWGCAQLFEDK